MYLPQGVYLTQGVCTCLGGGVPAQGVYLLGWGCVPVKGGVPAPGGLPAQGGIPALGVYLPRGCTCLRGVPVGGGVPTVGGVPTWGEGGVPAQEKGVPAQVLPSWTE